MTEEFKEGGSSDEEVERLSAKVNLKKEIEQAEEFVKKEEEPREYTDEEGVRWVTEKKRPNIALLNHYQCTWKPKNNHFLRHTDVKPKGRLSQYVINTLIYIHDLYMHF